MHVLYKQTVGVVPTKEYLKELLIVDRITYIANNLLYAFLLELEVLSSHDGRVNEVQTKSVGTILVNNLSGVGVILESLTHLLPVTGCIRVEKLNDTYAASTNPFTMRFLNGGLSKSKVESTNKV